MSPRIKKIKIFFPPLIIFSALLVPGYIYAELVPTSCRDYICGLCDLFHLGKNIINFLLFRLAVPLGTIGFIIGGVFLLTAADSEQKRTRGKEIIKNVVIGLLIAFFAWVILNTILLTIGFRVPYGEGALKDWWEFPNCPAGPSKTTETPGSGGAPDPPSGPPSSGLTDLGFNCSSDSECRSGVCDFRATGGKVCIMSELTKGANCDYDRQCRAGRSCVKNAYGGCCGVACPDPTTTPTAPTPSGSPGERYSECTTGSCSEAKTFCSSEIAGTRYCLPNKVKMGDSCFRPRQCPKNSSGNKVCKKDIGRLDGKCQ